MGWEEDLLGKIDSGASKVWGAGKSVAGRIGQATGLSSPKDMVDENAAMLPAEQAAQLALQNTLRQQQEQEFLKQQALSITGAQPIQAPTISGVPNVTYQAPEFYGQGPTSTYTAPTIERPRDVQLGPVDTNIDIGKMQPTALATNASIMPIERAQASQIGDAALARSSNVAGAEIAPLATALRSERLDFGKQMLNAPSVADAEYKAALARASSEALGAAAQSRGADRASARRSAVLGIAQQGVAGAAQLAAARAAEEIAKQKAYADTLGGVQTSDVAIATKQAELSQAQKSLQAQLEVAVSQGNRDAINAIRTRQAELDTEISKTNAQAENARQMKNSEMATQTSIVNAQQQNQGNQFQYGTTADMARAMLNAKLDYAKTGATVASGNADRNATLSTQQAGLTAQALRDAASADNQRAANEMAARNALASSTAANQLAAGTTNAANAFNVSSTNAKLGFDANRYNSESAAQAERDRIAASQAAVSAGQGASAGINSAANTFVNIGNAKIGGQSQQQAAQSAADERLVKGVTTGLSAYATSDERAKRDVTTISDAELKDLADELSRAARFRYKPGIEDGGKEAHAGLPSAQELERNPVGKLFVSETDDNVKQVDYGQLGALMGLAALRASRRSNRG